MSNDAAIFDRITPYIKNFTSAVDVGAHKGVWTEKLALAFRRVYCFEPNVLLYNRLSSWCDNDHDNVTVYNVALLNYIGVGSMRYDEGYEEKSRAHYVFGDVGGSVDIDMLDSYKIDGCGLLKIDVEGGEFQVIQGARRILRHQKPIVVVEYKMENARRFGWSIGTLSKYMTDLRYTLAFSKKPNFVFV